MKSLFEEMGGTYRQEGDYLLPNLSLPPDGENYQIGKYGRLRKQYLKEHRPGLYTCMHIKIFLRHHQHVWVATCVSHGNFISISEHRSIIISIMLLMFLNP